MWAEVAVNVLHCAAGWNRWFLGIPSSSLEAFGYMHSGKMQYVSVLYYRLSVGFGLVMHIMTQIKMFLVDPESVLKKVYGTSVINVLVLHCLCFSFSFTYVVKFSVNHLSQMCIKWINPGAGSKFFLLPLAEKPFLLEPVPLHNICIFFILGLFVWWAQLDSSTVIKEIYLFLLQMW